MKVAFFDPGLALAGWAIAQDAKLIDFGAIATSSKTPLGDRLLEIRGDVVQILTLHKPDVVAYEKPFFLARNTNAAVVQFALGVIVMAIAEAGYSKPIEFKPAEIKFEATGSGKATKLEIKEAMMQIYGITHTKGMPDDAYDAAAGAYTTIQRGLFEVAA